MGGGHHKLIIEPAGGAHNYGKYQADDPFVATLIALGLTGQAHKHISDNGQENTGPLQQIKLFSKDKNGAHNIMVSLNK